MVLAYPSVVWFLYYIPAVWMERDGEHDDMMTKRESENDTTDRSQTVRTPIGGSSAITTSYYYSGTKTILN